MKTWVRPAFVSMSRQLINSNFIKIGQSNKNINVENNTFLKINTYV